MNADYFPIWIALYFGIAALCVPVVSALGPVSIRNYVLEYSYSKSTGASNIAYRVLAPILCCYAIILLFSIFISSSIGLPYYSWISVLSYWAIMVILKTATSRISIPIVAFVMEIAFSLTIAALVDMTVMHSIFDSGIDALDDSNIAFQLELAVFFVVVQVIASISTRQEYRIMLVDHYRYRTDSKAFADFGKTYKSYGAYRSLVDTSEMKLFEYERRFGSLLSDRFTSDPLLRTLFFSIMAIEDSNRPAGVRLLERIASVFGAAKTTGIMQQKSDGPLSDEESVVLAMGYVETMWDKYLAYYAKSKQGLFSEETICFAPSWYIYDYELLATTLDQTFSKLYGDYCGTRLLDADTVFREVRMFEERNHYGLAVDKVSAPGSICLPESLWVSMHPAYWKNSYTISSIPSAISIPANCEEREIWAESKSFVDVEKTVEELKNSGFSIFEVAFSDHAFVAIRFICRNDANYSLDQEGWKTSRFVMPR